MRILFSLIILLLAHPLLAAPRAWRTQDTVLAGLAAVGGSALGASVGWPIGRAMAGDCDKTQDSSEDELLGPCFMHGVTEAVIGGAIVSNFGAAAGVSLYGYTEGFDGSFWGAFGGSLVGMAAGGLVGYGLGAAVGGKSGGPALGFVGVIFGQAAGAVTGYIWTLTPSEDPVMAHGGLLDFDPHHGLRLGVPTGGLRWQADGTVGVGLTLAAGMW